jgi:hypothetical protein
MLLHSLYAGLPRIPVNRRQWNHENVSNIAQLWFYGSTLNLPKAESRSIFTAGFELSQPI